MKEDTAILLLAAGASKRLGTPKQLLPFGETTLLEDTILKVLPLSERNVYVVLGAHAGRIEPIVKNLPIKIIKNENWESGMGSSISAGVCHIKQQKGIKKILITLVDLPLLKTSNYRELLNTYETSTKGISVTKYLNNKGVPVIFDSSYFESLSQLSGEEGAKSILIQNKSDVAYYDANIAYFDIDTKDDYLALIAS